MCTSCMHNMHCTPCTYALFRLSSLIINTCIYELMLPMVACHCTHLYCMCNCDLFWQITSLYSLCLSIVSRHRSRMANNIVGTIRCTCSQQDTAELLARRFFTDWEMPLWLPMLTPRASIGSSVITSWALLTTNSENLLALNSTSISVPL